MWYISFNIHLIYYLVLNLDSKIYRTEAKHIMLSDNELKVSMDYSGGADEATILQRFQMILHGKLQTRSKFKMVMGYLVCVILFAISYLVILQPWIPSPEISEIDTGFEAADITPETSYVMCETDGALDLYCNDIYWGTIPQSILDTAPFNELSIIYKNKTEELTNGKE